MVDERVIPLTPADPDPNAQVPLGGGSDITIENPDAPVNLDPSKMPAPTKIDIYPPEPEGENHD